MDKLMEMPVWLIWRYEEGKDGNTKVPYSARTMKKTGANPPYAPQWVSYDQASYVAKANHFDGVGFVVPEGYAVIDLDDQTDAYVNEIHNLIPSYMELSPSGAGRHIIAKVDPARVPQKDGRLDPRFYVNNKKKGTEVYIGGLTNHFMTFTGDALTPDKVCDCTEGIVQFLQKHMKKESLPDIEEVELEEYEIDDLEAYEIIDIAKRAKNAEKFSKLYDKGDISDYGSHSEADIALCNYLAFYSQGNAYAIDKLFRESALYRNKWERDDYRITTIRKAVALCKGNYCTGSAPRPPFVIEDMKKRRIVSCPHLAKHFRENQYLLSVRDSGRGGVQRYLYVDGCYRPYADEMLKGVIKGYVTDYDEALLHMRDVNEVFQQLITDLHFVRSDEINSDEDLINFTNGLLDIRTFTLKHHSPEVLSTIQLPCEWTGESKPTPIFDSFLDALTKGDDQIKELLIEFVGVTLSNIKGWRFKKALFMVGPGDSGKSVLKSLVERILGKGNFVAIDLREIEARFGTGNIYGKRLAGSSDMSFMTVDELKTFKKCTGGDSLFAEFKGQNGFEFVYDGLLWFCMNKLPRFGGDDGDWVYNRIIKVEFDNVIPVEYQDKHLIDKLFAEREGIVYRVIMALKTVIDNGYVFSEPQSVIDARKQYHDENNTVIAFFNDCMEERAGGKISDACTTGKVFKVYQEWCRDNNHGFAKTAKEFRNDLSNHMGASYQDLVVRRGTGGSYFKGYTLSDEAKEYYRRAYGYDDIEPLLGA